MKTIAIILTLLTGSLFTQLSAGITRYVSLTGSNTPPYTSLATAATTIQAAIGISTGGDLILVDNGTYMLSTPVVINIGITLRSLNGSNVTSIDGNHAVKCMEINHSSAVVDGFLIKNGYNPSGFGGGVNIIGGGTLQNCYIKGCQARDGGGVAIDNNGLVQNCWINNNKADNNSGGGYGGGIRILNDGEVRNCIIHKNTSVQYGGGINIWNKGIVKNCAIVENSAPNGGGIRTRNNSKIYNSIIYYNTGSNYEVNGSGYYYYNCCTTPALPTSYSVDCISSLPQFITPPPGTPPDFHLMAGSPCIDAGMNFSWMTTVPDFDGNPRIVGGVCDMGPYEYQIPVPADTDGDGIADVDDDYPADPDRAFDNFFPATGNGTLAYEDLWPGKGDYDFNDLVCDYRFKTVTNASNHVVEIFGTFIIEAFGAHLSNGFGFQFPNDNVNPAHLTVTGYDLAPGSYISLMANGLESGQDKPTIILYDNAYRLMPHPGMGIGVNTTPGAPYVTPDTLQIYIDFSVQSYTIPQVNIAAFNPFIIVDQNRDVEVHLPDYPPTSLANPAYFGTMEDDSEPSSGRYYKTANNLPWAININASFDYPKEKIEIPQAYLHFVEWAVSSGALYPDWYLDLPGYRNASNIY